MKKNKPIVVAQIMGKWVGGGVEAVIMNYYRHIDRNKVQFDFICDEDSTNIPYEEIESLGGKVIICPRYQSVFKYQKFLINLFKTNNYKIVHSNINTLSVFPLRAAKKAGVPVRIAHSHSTSNKAEWKKNIIKNILRIFSKKYANEYLACSELAGRYMFGNKTFNNGKVTVINNAINLDAFRFDKKLRDLKRRELEISKDTFVIGHIGRFVAQKNHEFLIDIFNEFHKNNKNSILLLIGQGPKLNEIMDKVNNLGLSNSVKFMGQRDDVKDLYQVMDIFLFPSLYEGLGMVAIEAQVNGLPCVVSSEVPLIAKVSDYISFVDLKEDVSVWSKCIKNFINCNRTKNNLHVSDYDINHENVKLQNYYFERIK